jgi:hypothetical protein
MRKLRQAAVLVAALGSIGFVTAGTAQADQGGYGRDGGGRVSVLQSSTCRSHDLNIDILGEVGLANGVGGNLFNGEGDSGAQDSSLGSSMGCSNTVGGGK